MRIAPTLSLWLIVLLQLSQIDMTQTAKPEEAWKSPQTPFLSGSSKTNFVSKSSFGKIRNLQNTNTSLTQANFTIFLNNMQVFGHWFNGISAGPLNYLTQNTGFAWIEAANSDDTDTSDNTPMLDIDLIIFNGEYVDENSLTIRMLSNYQNWEFIQANATMTATNITLPVFQDDSDTSQACVANVSIFFIDISNNQPFISSADTNDNFGVQFLVSSPGCSISIFTNVLTLTDTTSEQLIIYICVMSFAALMGLYSANRLRIGFPVYMEKLKKFSIWSIWLINAWDFYIFLLHVALAVESSAWLMIIALLYFALSIIYQTRLVYAIYFSTQQGSVENVVTGCKFFAAYYCMLYLIDFSYTYYAKIEWLLITSSFYLVPQIYHVYQRGKKYKFNFFHVFGFLFSRLFFITYLKLYPDNIYRSSPNLAFVFTYIGFVLIQICILLIQGKWPRFWKTPKPFNYYVQLHTEEEKQEMCAICMEPLGETPFDPAKPLLEKARTTVVMQTPCNHRYHTSCLQEWMKAKLVCPFDRLDIPSLNNEEVS